MDYIVLAGLLLYIILLITLLIGLNNIVVESALLPGKVHHLSVIVPFRNEIKNLPRLMDCLKGQDYPLFEVVFVDDHSTDDSADYVLERCRSEKRFKLIRADGPGKKRALTDGIRAAKGEVIVTTDADCIFGMSWLSEMNKAFANKNVELVFGPVHMERGDTFFQILQQLEFASVIGSGMAMYGLKHPLFCNAANLAYRKEAFEAVGGFKGNDHVPSGDDQFLLDKMKSAYKGAIYLLNTEEALVTTRPQATVRKFVHQRLRWAGKWSRTMTFAGRALAIFVFVMQFVFIIAWWHIATERSSSLIVMMGVKFLLEFVIISSVISIAGQRTSVLHFVVLQLIYPFYVIGIGVLSNFASFEWKGRQHAPMHRNMAVKR